MNVYDGERMAELLGGAGMTAGGRRRGRRPGRPQHLPHPRESRRKSLFGCRPAAPRRRLAAADRAGRLRRPGRGRRGPGALADDRHRRRPASLSPPAASWSPRPRRGARPIDTDMPGAGQVRRAARAAAAPAPAPSSPSRKAATNSAPIASCPTPAAPRFRGRGPTSSPRRTRWSTAARARSSCSARTSTRGATASAASTR